eukprot:bmy_04323T0
MFTSPRYYLAEMTGFSLLCWARNYLNFTEILRNRNFSREMERALVVATACVPLKIVPMPGILHKWKQGTA